MVGFGVSVPIDGRMDGTTVILVLCVLGAAVVGVIAQIAGSFSGGTSAPEPVVEGPNFDQNKWNALVKYDPDIKRIVEALSPYGPKYIDQFATAFMALNDKNYLPQIIQDILATAKADGAQTILQKGGERVEGKL
jgi:hypothetical protein